MLSIGEFSNICKVSTKTLRYYAIEQLEKMLFINRLKAYSFSLDEIKDILQLEEGQDDGLYLAFLHKKKEIEKRVYNFNQILAQ